MRNVLVVDDEPDIRLLARLILTGCGYAVHEAATGEEALAVLPDVDPDLALIDLRMPGMGGWALAAALRHARPELPVVIVSAHTHPHYVERADALGCGYLTKPFTAGGLQDALARTAERARRREHSGRGDDRRASGAPEPAR